MKLRTTIQPVAWLQAILLLLVIVYCSCKKSDTKIINGKDLYVEKFFEKPVSGTEELNRVIDMLKTENEKSGFVNALPEGAGVPVWNKLVVEKRRSQPGDAARGIIADKDGNLLIPLSKDFKTLSSLLFVMKKEDKYEFYCYDNNYAYGVAFGDKYTKKEKESVIGLFMAMSNYVFGARVFKNIPNNLFESFLGEPEETGLTKKVFMVLAKDVLPDIFISDGNANPGPVVGPTKCYWEFTGKCNCAGSDNTPENCKHPHEECPSGICTKKVCYTLIFDNESGPGTEPPPSNPNNGTGIPPVAPSSTNWSNNNGSPLPDRADNLPNSPCGNTNCTWYVEAPEYHFEDCDPNSNPEELEAFYNYVQMVTPLSIVEANNSDHGPDPITGTYTWTVAEGLAPSWRIQAVTNYSYHHTRYYTVDGTVEDNFDLFYFVTGEGYFVGSQTFTSSTYVTRNPTINQVLNNNTQNTQGKSRVIGTVRHTMKIFLPLCPNPPEIDFTEEVNNTTTFIPR